MYLEPYSEPLYTAITFANNNVKLGYDIEVVTFKKNLNFNFSAGICIRGREKYLVCFWNNSNLLILNGMTLNSKHYEISFQFQIIHLISIFKFEIRLYLCKQRTRAILVCALQLKITNYFRIGLVYTNEISCNQVNSI
jgi:hypothetical protein